MFNTVLLLASVLFGTGRSVFSKKAALSLSDKKPFYINQSILFLVAAIAIFLFDVNAFSAVTGSTIVYGIVFGVSTFFAQWCYTIALDRGPTSICAMVYSFGFLIPTISGSLFWKEPFGPFSAIGLIFAIAAVITSSFSKSGKKLKKGFILPSIIAMLFSGMLGLLQKMHQSSGDAQNLQAFLTIAFLLAALISLFPVFFSKSKNSYGKADLKPASLIAGFCFGMVSMLNTMLAGRLPSSIVFPSLNIGVMIMCVLAGRIVFKEKLSRFQMLALMFGLFAITMLSMEK